MFGANQFGTAVLGAGVVFVPEPEPPEQRGGGVVLYDQLAQHRREDDEFVVMLGLAAVRYQAS